MKPSKPIFIGILALIFSNFLVTAQGLTIIPDTGQTRCFSNTGPIGFTSSGSRFFGQDANYQGTPQAFQDNRDGTVTDLTTGLIWSKAVDAKKVSLAEAMETARNIRLAGFNDWRVPNIKELYSLINFSGTAGHSGIRGGKQRDAVPYINTDYFNFKYGNVRNRERYIDAQWLSSTRYVSKTMDGADTLFGVNFADGRIKGYGYSHPRMRRTKKFYVRFVRGCAYGQNEFSDNTDGTVTDRATGLMWMKNDSGRAMTWEEALVWAESKRHAGYDDWRLPNAKEIQYIVDYTRSPDTTGSAAIDPVFKTTAIVNEAGEKDYPHFWTGTTHLDGPFSGNSAVTVCFGRALGKMHGRIMDVHGAGAQRSDPKTGRSQIGRGPQGDARRNRNFVRLVRGGAAVVRTKNPVFDKSKYPFVVKVDVGFEADLTAMGQPGNQSARRSFNGSGSDFIRRLDQNGDGRVSRFEFDGPADHFHRLDRNGDGTISRTEAPAGPPSLRPDRF